jgi:hypothetical protein
MQMLNGTVLKGIIPLGLALSTGHVPKPSLHMKKWLGKNQIKKILFSIITRMRIEKLPVYNWPT